MEDESQGVAPRATSSTPDPDPDDDRVRSPEEVAREFLLHGTDTTHTSEETPSGHRQRSRASIARVAGIVGVVVVLAGLAALVLYPTHPGSSPGPNTTSPPNSSRPADDSRATTTTAGTSTNGTISVDVLNAGASASATAGIATSLRALGFGIGHVVSAPGPIAAGQPSEILYSPTGSLAAEQLAKELSGPITAIQTPNLAGSHLQLWVANQGLTVKG